METIQVTAIELAYDWGEGNGVLVCDGPEGRVKAKGPVAGFAGGQSLALTGYWTDHPKFGRQFQVETVKVGRPTAGPGLLKWMGRIHGVGPKTARAISEHFGEGTDLLEIIEKQPKRLEEIDGIGSKKAKNVSAAIKKRSKRDDLCINLENAGVPTAAVSRVISRYGDDAPDIVARAPYSLLRIRGIGFKTADTIAMGSGSVSHGSFERVRAGVVETLRQAAAGGHVFLPPSILVKGKRGSIMGACRLLNLNEGYIGDLMTRIEESGYIKWEGGSSGNAIYLAKLWRQEVVAAGQLAHLASAKVQKLDTATVTPPLGMKYSPEQIGAIQQAATQSTLIITGGPGVGKTEITRAIVELYRSAGLYVELAAPTGRAAKRLSEATGAEAKTIHRLLEYNPREGFARNRYEPLECQAIILDEFSMVDVDLAARLFEAIPHGCRLVLVGDKDQLPSVGPGIVLKDIIDSHTVPTVHLKTVFRQSAGSMIISNAHRFIREEPIEYPDNGNSDFYFIRRNQPADVLKLVADCLLYQIPRKWGLDPLRDIMVLTPQNKGPLGTIALNKHLQDLINPDGERIGNRPIRVGDRVMQTKNNYGLEVFNGDIGRLTHWDSREKLAKVKMGDHVIIYAQEDLRGLVPAYASTVHKFQGSEIPAVIGICHGSHAWMLRTNLFYTMMTRAKQVLVLIGHRGALEKASHNRRDLERYSRLSFRLAHSPDELPELDRAEIIAENVWTCNAEDCHHTWESSSPQVYTCPECGSENVRELKAGD